MLLRFLHVAPPEALRSAICRLRMSVSGIHRITAARNIERVHGVTTGAGHLCRAILPCVHHRNAAPRASPKVYTRRQTVCRTSIEVKGCTEVPTNLAGRASLHAARNTHRAPPDLLTRYRRRPNGGVCVPPDQVGPSPATHNGLGSWRWVKHSPPTTR